MIPRRILAIYRKDLVDSIRDARILVALITPLVIGIVYSFAFGGTNTPSASLVVANPGGSALVEQLVAAVKGHVDLSVRTVDSADAVQQQIADDKADLGLIIPDGFDAGLKSGQTPDLKVLLSQNGGIGTQYTLASLDPVLRAMAGQHPPAQVDVSSVALNPANLTIVDKMSLRTWSIVLSLVLMVTMVSLLAVPIILAEETEKKTIDALVLVSSYEEVVVAKALLGGSFVVIMTAILLATTRLAPVSIPWFLIGIAALAICLLGFGLMLGSVFKSATQLNTWSGLLLAPAVVPAALIGFGISPWVDRIASLTPTGAGMKLLTNAFADQRVYDRPAGPLAVLIVWAIIFYGLLLWQLSRRRA